MSVSLNQFFLFCGFLSLLQFLFLLQHERGILLEGMLDLLPGITRLATAMNEQSCFLERNTPLIPVYFISVLTHVFLKSRNGAGRFQRRIYRLVQTEQPLILSWHLTLLLRLVPARSRHWRKPVIDLGLTAELAYPRQHKVILDNIPVETDAIRQKVNMLMRSISMADGDELVLPEPQRLRT